ncbi:MAG TPA: Mur ligase family protein [Cytophagaceae bacterium]|jgi:UDP-N-acetylmuramate: L-alanyl-gamma-D-glutamyl-meso-diaminopimelate ligase|nr:Mur ligase family protein [Cytophagaceae bacterium]
MSEENKKIHFIAIGGSVMHNLALALHEKGYLITGSDDEIFEPSKSRLAKAGILPDSTTWDPSKIHKELHAVILGMHANPDNPELLKAKELGLKIYTYPEYIYQQSLDKQRVVIAGSHGKTTITGMILHVMKYFNRKFDYLIGTPLEGFDITVKLSDDAPIIIIEGDEHLNSSIDRTPKFLKYHHHIGLVSAVAWDHINIFPTLDEYVKQFDAFADATPKAGTLIFCESDAVAAMVCKKERDDVTLFEYKAHKNDIENKQTYLITDVGEVPVHVFGKHNMKNLSGAKAVLSKIGITDKMFYEAIQSFKGVANRLEILAEGKTTIIFKDFAHAPSELKASTNAVKKQFEKRSLTAVLELHTYSSLNKEFLSQYADSFKGADQPVVYYNLTSIEHKEMEPVNEKELKEAFNSSDLKVFTDSLKLKKYLLDNAWDNKNLLLMSSGDFDGLDLKDLANVIVKL